MDTRNINTATSIHVNPLGTFFKQAIHINTNESVA